MPTNDISWHFFITIKRFLSLYVVSLKLTEKKIPI